MPWSVDPVTAAELHGRAGVEVTRGRLDFGRGRWRASAGHALDAVRAVLRARRADALVLMTVGDEVLVAGLLLRALDVLPRRRRARLVVVDFLGPRSTAGRRLRRFALGRVDRWLCIRSGDRETLARTFDVTPTRATFLPFPAPPPTVDDPRAATDAPGDAPYVYAAGNAHRDWPLLVAAAPKVRSRIVIMADGGHPALRDPLPDNVFRRDMVAPAAAREIMRAATVVAVPLIDTHLPAGPLVLVDALAAGKPVVATDVNGTRDYVVDGETALTVAPGDHDGLADALNRLLEDHSLAHRLADNARQWAISHLGTSAFVDTVLEEARRHT